MKTRAVLLIALMISGAYMMIQSYQDESERGSTQFLSQWHKPFNSLTFSKPAISGFSSDTWVVDDPEEIEALLLFLEHYHVRKLKPEEIDITDDIDHFSIRLQDEEDNSILIIINENLIIQNSSLYYEIVDGPLDKDWLVQFILNNHL
ncbi:hypothetical protein AB1K83_03980 [Sporosarcina sp. 179-K 3D1 HS]|uniref:hypothetical protein n=1 Tax=Sporosarcina sp. 179-K 3D1 HS TaxID=3232169 RepID=UPI0039A0BD6B